MTTDLLGAQVWDSDGLKLLGRIRAVYVEAGDPKDWTRGGIAFLVENDRGGLHRHRTNEVRLCDLAECNRRYHEAADTEPKEPKS